MSWLWLAAPVAAGAVTWIAIGLLVSGRWWVPLDQPKDRSLHTAPIPRVGGVAVMAGALPLIAVSGSPFLALGLLALGLVAISVVDDVRGLPVRWRLAAHLAVAGCVTYILLPDCPLPLRVTILLALVWMTNLYNFMDGSDGLAGGMSAFGFAVYALVALARGDIGLATASLGIVACAVAFLRFNFHPARVFLGDAGSIPLGFLAGSLGLYGIARGLWPVWFPALVFSPFIVDASVTLLRRAARGDKIWTPHRNHYYQRLVRAGLGHRRTALAEYGVMVATGASALLAAGLPPAGQAAVLAMWAAIYVALARGIDRWWDNFERGSNAA